MPKIKHDAQECLLATCPEGKSKLVLWDTAIASFTLVVCPGGGRTYYLRYWDKAGRQRQITIGGYADITFDKAPKKAHCCRLGPSRRRRGRRLPPPYPTHSSRPAALFGSASIANSERNGPWPNSN